MTAFQPEFIPVAKSAASPADARFTPISFARKRMSELCEGYYCIELEGGRTEFVEAASALEALRLAQGMGKVTRIQRESLQRRRMVKQLANPEANEAEEEPLIKPGTVLLSFETLCRWQDKQAGIAPAEEPAPSTAAEVAAALLAEVRQGGAEAEPATV